MRTVTKVHLLTKFDLILMAKNLMATFKAKTKDKNLTFKTTIKDFQLVIQKSRPRTNSSVQ